MGAISGPNIINDGLVFCVDAENKKSYPGSGTSWTDIASNTDSLEVTNGTFNSPNYIRFSGGYARWADIAPKIAEQDKGTISMWWYQENGSGNDSIINTGDFSTNWNIYKMSMMFNHTTDKLSVYCYAGSTTAVITGDFGDAISLNTLYNIVWTSAGHLYLNGSLHANLSNTFWFDTMTGHDYFMFGAPALNNYVYGDQRCTGRLYNLMIYNKELSASEIMQNYNAYKVRFT